MTITLRDVTMRDGLQDEHPISTAAKLDLFDALVRAGVRDIEVASFVRADRVPAMADAAEVVADAMRRAADDVRLCALVPNRRGAEDAVAAGIRHLVFVVSVSERHNTGNVGLSVDASMAALATIVSVADEVDGDVEVVLATSFGCPYAGPIDADDVLRRAVEATASGVRAISLADTIGTGVPTEVADLVRRVIASTSLPVGAHLHDTRGLGVANALAAIAAGAIRVDGAVGGLGGCPFAPGASGNLALEDLVDCLEGMGMPTGIDIDALVDAAALACALVDRDVTSHVGVAGPRHRRRAAS